MKKIFVYALTYIGITAAVATTVAVVGPAIIKTSDTVNKTNPVDEEDDEDDDEEETPFEYDDVSCMISGLTSMRYVNISNAEFNIVDTSSNETYIITLEDLYLTIDIEGLMAGDMSGLNASGTIGVNAYGIDVKLDFEYSDLYNTYDESNVEFDSGRPLITPELNEDPYGKCIFISNHYDHSNLETFNPYLSGKMYTNDLIEGVNHVLDELDIELPDFDLDMDLDSNALIEKMMKMSFAPVEGSSYEKGTLDLGDMFELDFALPVDLYVAKSGSGFDKQVLLKRGVINPFEIEGFIISGDVALETHESSIKILQPDARDYYPDYSRAFDIFDQIMALSKQKEFAAEYTFDIAKGSKHYGSIGGNALLDLNNGVWGQANVGVEMLGVGVNLTTTYQDNDIYFDVNGILKTKLQAPTMTQVLDYFKQNFGNDSLAAIAKGASDFIANPYVQKILSGDYSDIEALCDSVVYTGGEIIARINTEALGLSKLIKGEIVLVLDEGNKTIKALYLEGVQVYSYLEDCYYDLTAFINIKVDEVTELGEHYLGIINEYAEVGEGYYKIAEDYANLGIKYFNHAYERINELDFEDANVYSNIFEEILDMTNMKKFAANFDVDLTNIIDGVQTDTTIGITGYLQVDMTDAFNTSYPTKTYGMKLYASVDILVIDHPEKIHKAELQIIHDVVYVSYMNKMKFQINLSTIAEMATKIMTIIGYEMPSISDYIDLGAISSSMTNVQNIETVDQVETGKKIYDFLSSGKTSNIFDTINEIKEALKMFKSYELRPQDDFYAVTLDKDYCGMQGDLTLAYTPNTPNGDCLEILGIRNGIDNVDIVMYFVDFNEDIYMSTNLNDYFDFNTLNILLDFGIKDLDRTYFHLTGAANVTIVGDIGLDVQIWIDENKKLTAKVMINDIPTVDLVNRGGSEYAHADPDHYESGTTLFVPWTKDYGYTGAMTDVSNVNAKLYVQNDMVYIEHTETERFRCGLDWVGHDDIYTRHAICPLSEFTQTDYMLHYIFETILDMTESLQGTIYDALVGTDINDMELEDVLRDYYMSKSGSDTIFTFGLDLDALSEDSSILSNEYLYLYANQEELYKLKFTLKIASILSINATLTLTDSQKDSYSTVCNEINNFHDCKYVWNATYHETASHPDK